MVEAKGPINLCILNQIHGYVHNKQGIGSKNYRSLKSTWPRIFMGNSLAFTAVASSKI